MYLFKLRAYKLGMAVHEITPYVIKSLYSYMFNQKRIVAEVEVNTYMPQICCPKVRVHKLCKYGRLIMHANASNIDKTQSVDSGLKFYLCTK